MMAAVGKGPTNTANQVKQNLAADWQGLQELKLSPSKLDQQRIVSYKKSNPAHLAFDMLRTNLLNMMRSNGWTRLAITSPTKNCGKSMVVANLALALGHQADLRSIVLDMDMRSPALAKLFDVRERLSIAELLRGRIEPHQLLRRVGTNLAFGLNTEAVVGAAEVIHNERTHQMISGMVNRYKPGIVVYDLPPMLVSDDVSAILPHVDCVLMVAAAGRTTPKEINEAEQMIGSLTNFLGVMLNKSREKTAQNYYYQS